jgi:hypothetical protein
MLGANEDAAQRPEEPGECERGSDQEEEAKNSALRLPSSAK